MNPIGKSSLVPDLALTGSAGSPASSNLDGKVVQVRDQVQLSRLTATISQGRSDRIAALRTMVAATDYSPSSVSISHKLVSGALSRAE